MAKEPTPNYPQIDPSTFKDYLTQKYNRLGYLADSLRANAVMLNEIIEEMPEVDPLVKNETTDSSKNTTASKFR